MLNYNDFLDKVYGCFLGKTVIGTLGAPFEGVKMPQAIKFEPEMIHTVRPNDDLDLQVLWLDVAEKYGKDLTSYDLLDRFVHFSDYGAGEYAVMRKNFQRGVYPPLSGKFSNDFYTCGMGCPIRSEIWACLFPDDSETAAKYAEKDGILDHAGDSVYAEMFLSALESAAFTESDPHKLIEIGLSAIPTDCKIRRVITNTVAWCGEYNDIKLVLRKILFNYGHPDCTNMFQNVGILISAFLLGGLDLIETGMMALNCGFDTDCTCATVGAIIGTVRGAKSLIDEYELSDIKYVLGGVTSFRRSDSVFDLSEDIAHLAVVFNPDRFENAPACERTFEKHPQPFEFSVIYENDDPTAAPEKPCRATLCAKNISDNDAVGKLSVKGLDVDTVIEMNVKSGSTQCIPFEFNIKSDIIYDKNLIDVDFDGVEQWQFGVIGCSIWKVIGPIWKTTPECTPEALSKVDSFWDLLAKVDGDPTDILRHFHLNYEIDPSTNYLSEDEIFSMTEDNQSKYEISTFVQRENLFRISDFCGFRGPSVFYLAREVWSDEDMDVCVQVGYSAPVKLYINGKLMAVKKECDTWTAENIHIENVHMKKGKNRFVLRLTQVNDDSRFNLIFSKGITCNPHLVCFGTALK